MKWKFDCHLWISQKLSFHFSLMKFLLLDKKKTDYICNFARVCLCQEEKQPPVGNRATQDINKLWWLKGYDGLRVTQYRGKQSAKAISEKQPTTTDCPQGLPSKRSPVTSSTIYCRFTQKRFSTHTKSRWSSKQGVFHKLRKRKGRSI